MTRAAHKPAAAHDRAHAYVAAALAVLGGVGWLNAEIGALQQGHADTFSEAAQQRADLRELRSEITDCRRNR